MVRALLIYWMEELKTKPYLKNRVMIRTILIIFFLLAIINTDLPAQVNDTLSEKLTLQQCIQIALKNNSIVQRREVTSGIAKANWQNAKGYMLPTLNGDANNGINNGRSIDPYTNAFANQSINFANYSLNSSLILFNVFSIQHGIRQNKLAFEASRFEVQQQKDVVALNVILQYLQILTNEDLLAAAIQQQVVSSKQVERLSILNQEGNISPNLLYDLKGEFAQNQLTVVNAQADLQTAKVTLAQLLNMPYNKNTQIERLSLTGLIENSTANTDSIYEAALRNLAIIKAAELRRNSSVYGVKTYRSQRYPSLYFSGGIYTNYSSIATTQKFINSTDNESSSYVLENGSKLPVYVKQDNYTIEKIPYRSQFSNNVSSSVIIGIRIPLLNNLRNKTQVKTALLQQKDAEIILNNTKVQLQQNVEQAFINVNSAKNRFATLTDQVNAYKESFRVIEIKFNAGAVNSVDYLVAKNNLDRANLNLIIAKYDYALRSMILEYYSGKLKF